VTRRTAASSGRGARAGFILAGAACFVCIGIGSLGSIAACGGRVDGVTGSSGSSSASGTSGGVAGTPGQKPPGTGRPPRPPAGPLTNAAVASALAEDYCKTFSSCCVGIHQPPIDVARCRELTSAAVEKELDAGGATESRPSDVAACVDAVHTRVVACALEDLRWRGNELPLLQPSPISAACAPLFPPAPSSPFEACSVSMPCSEPDNLCAIDVCAPAPAIGSPCNQGACRDTGNCVAGSCVAGSTAGVDASCSSNVDCRLGLVCFEMHCAPTRDHTDLATRRSSPYRVGADTCSAYSYL
jgi:hypothetical protein